MREHIGFGFSNRRFSHELLYACVLVGALIHEHGFLLWLATTTSQSPLVVVIVADWAHPISLFIISLAIPEIAEAAARKIVVATELARPITRLPVLGILVDDSSIPQTAHQLDSSTP